MRRKTIGLGQVVAASRVDPAAVGERGQHVERAAAAQLRIAAAGDQLLGLDEELDLADAAAAELDVVAGDRDLLVAAMIVDLALDRMDVGDRRVVEIFAPDVGREFARGTPRPPAMSPATGARLDQRRALPVLAEALVVVERRLGRDGDVRRAGIGPQAQVDAEDVAVGGALLEDMRPAARVSRTKSDRGSRVAGELGDVADRRGRSGRCRSNS